MTKRKICKFYQSNSCTNANCTFLHVNPDPGPYNAPVMNPMFYSPGPGPLPGPSRQPGWNSTAAIQATIPCKYDQFCKRKKCPFLHSPKKSGGASGLDEGPSTSGVMNLPEPSPAVLSPSKQKAAATPVLEDESPEPKRPRMDAVPQKSDEAESSRITLLSNHEDEDDVDASIFERPSRERMIHLLAVKPFKQHELFSRMRREGLKNCRENLRKLLDEVADFQKDSDAVCGNKNKNKNNVYDLKKSLWKEVSQPDGWPYWTAEDRAAVQRRRPENSGPPSSDMGSTSSGQAVATTEPSSPLQTVKIEDYRDLEKERDDLDGAFIDLKREKKKCDDELKKSKRKISEMLNYEKDNSKLVHTLKDKNKKLSNEIDTFKATIIKKEDLIQQLLKKEQQNKKEFEELKEQHESLKADHQNLTDDLVAMEKERDDLDNTNIELEQELKDKHLKLLLSEASSNEKDSPEQQNNEETNSLNEKIANYESVISKLKDAAEESNETVKKNKVTNQQQKSVIKHLNSKILEIEKEKNEQKQKLAETITLNEEKGKEVEDLNKTCQDLNGQIVQIKEEMSIQKQKLDESMNSNIEKDQELRELILKHNEDFLDKALDKNFESTLKNTNNSELQLKYDDLESQYNLLKKEIEKQQSNILFFKEENRKKDENIRKFKEDFLPFLNSYFEKN